MQNSAGIFLFDSNNQLLICTPYGGPDKNNGFTIPKGKKEKDEDLLDAAIRETYEECGFDCIPYKEDIPYIGFEKYNHGKKRLHGYVLKLDFPLRIDMFECQSFTEKGKPEIIKFHLVDIDVAQYCLHYVQGKLLKCI